MKLFNLKRDTRTVNRGLFVGIRTVNPRPEIVDFGLYHAFLGMVFKLFRKKLSRFNLKTNLISLTTSQRRLRSLYLVKLSDIAIQKREVNLWNVTRWYNSERLLKIKNKLRYLAREPTNSEPKHFLKTLRRRGDRYS